MCEPLGAAKSVAATGTTATPAADQVVSLGDRFTLSYFLRAIECREIDLEQGGDRGEVQLCTSENGHGLPDWEQGFVDGDLADLETFWERCLGSLLALNLEVIGGKAAMVSIHKESLSFDNLACPSLLGSRFQLSVSCTTSPILRIELVSLPLPMPVG